MAEYLLKDMIKKSEDLAIKNWEILSAGISAVKGIKVNDKVKSVMEELNIDLSDHSSHNVEEIDLNQQDLIITMSRKHSRALVLEHPGLADNIFTLKELNENKNKGTDIEDPFGLSIEVYRETRDEIKKNLKFLLKNLKKFELREKD